MHWDKVLETLRTQGWIMISQHLTLVGFSLLFAMLIALPIGIMLTRKPFKKYVDQIISVFNTLQGVPSLAIVAIFVPIMGVGVVPSIVALTLYALLPIIRNTMAGIEDVSDDILEAARGMGMPKKRIFWRIELPIAMPVIVAGLQTSAVLTVGTAAIALLIGGGGLGYMIFSGINHGQPALTFTGSIITAMIAIGLDRGIGFVYKKFSSI